MAKQPTKTEASETPAQPEAGTEKATSSSSIEIDALKAQLDAAQKALIPVQDENVKLRDEVKQLKAALEKAAEVKAKAPVRVGIEVPEKGTFVFVDGKREEIVSGPRPFRDFIPEWRGRLINDGCLTVVLERHG